MAGPTFKRTRASGVASRLARPFLELNRAFGSPLSDEAMRQAGLDIEAMEDPDAYVPWPTIERVLTLAVEVSGRDDIGPAAAFFLQDAFFDVPEYAARHKATVGEAMACLSRFAPLHGDGVRWDTKREGKYARATLSTSGRSSHPVVLSYGLACVAIACRRYCGKRIPSLQAELTSPAPRVMEGFERALECPIRFGAAQNSLVAEVEVLDWPIHHADTPLSASLERVAEQMLAAHRADATLVEEVRGRIVDLLPRGECTIAHVSELLDLPVRTLRRRLKEEGATFRDLVDLTRIDLAERYLRDTELSIGEIAYLLGFSSSTAFVRAFRHRHGMTPLSFRRAARGAPG